VSALAWSPDGRFVATASDKTVRIIEATGKQVRIAHDRRVRAVAWSPDGLLVATASADNTARIVEAASGTERARITHDGEVRAVAWSRDGRLVATGSNDKTARIIEAATGKEQARFAHDGEVHGLEWSPDGAAIGPAIVTRSDDRTARVWRVWPTARAVVESAKQRAARCLTPAQRTDYVLPPAPPTWCVERRLWPYNGDEWQAWLPRQKAWLASGRRGDAPPLPKAE
jgi:dipeptidyl aminopeptidase/acylaminoacyl peptidase